MNYRHAFHAGNFADLAKHAALTHLLEGRAGAGPMTVIDTHGGAGVYDLSTPQARSSGEAALGITRLMADEAAPAGFAALKAAVRKLNGGALGPLYPGSPALILRALKSADRFVVCELREDDHTALNRLITNRTSARALLSNGFKVAPKETPARGRALVLIDPPYERADDYEQAAQCLAAILKRNRSAEVLIWLPLKDLETFDRFLRDLPPTPEPPLVIEARLRPLTDPMRLNGCGLVAINAPESLALAMRPIIDWVVTIAGETGGQSKIWMPKP